MSREKSNLTSLESRKQLLLLESELNRVQLLEDWKGLKVEINQLKNQMHGIGTLASSTMALFSLFSTVRQTLMKPESTEEKPAWVSRVLGLVQKSATLWSELRRNTQ